MDMVGHDHELTRFHSPKMACELVPAFLNDTLGLFTIKEGPPLVTTNRDEVGPWRAIGELR